MRKKLLFGVIAASLSLSLIGCSNESGGDRESESTQSATKQADKGDSGNENDADDGDKEETTSPEETKEPEQDIKEMSTVQYVGNLVSNVNESGGLITKGDNCYYFSHFRFTERNTFYGIKKYDCTTGTISSVVDMTPCTICDLNYCGDSIVYTQAGEDGESNITLMKVNLETGKTAEILGGGKKLEIGKSSFSITVNDWIYFTDKSDKLCRVDIDGNNYEVLVNEPAFYICPINDRIVYQLDSDKESLHYMLLNDKEDHKLNDRRSYIKGTHGDDIYFMSKDENDKQSLYKMKYDGTGEQKLFDFGDIEDVMIDTEKIYLVDKTNIYTLGFDEPLENKKLVDLKYGQNIKDVFAVDYKICEQGSSDGLKKDDFYIYNPSFTLGEMKNIEAYGQAYNFDISFIENAAEYSNMADFNNVCVYDDFLYVAGFYRKLPVCVKVNEDSSLGYVPTMVGEVFDNNNKSIITSEFNTNTIETGEGDYEFEYEK